MPSNWLYIDTNFPAFTREESADEKISTIQNYLYMLVEQLRYSLHNLDMANMNGTALANYTRSITDPIYAKIQDSDGNIAQLQLEASGLSLRLSNAEGDITSLGVTAKGLATRIANAEGDITSLGVTAQGLAARIANAEGDITTLDATAKGITTRVGNAEGALSTLQQTVNGFKLTATDNGSSTTFTLTSTGISVSTTVGSVAAAQATANSAASTASAALSRANTARTTAQQIANGLYEGTFINGNIIYAPSIYAGGGGGKVVGIDDDGITIYAGDETEMVLRISGYESGFGVMDRASLTTGYNTLAISAPDVVIGGGTLRFDKSQRINFAGAVVENLTVYFS